MRLRMSLRNVGKCPRALCDEHCGLISSLTSLHADIVEVVYQLLGFDLAKKTSEKEETTQRAWRRR